MNPWLWGLPLVGGFIGYCTNWIAVQMLLRPRKPIRIFGLTWLGLIPRRRKEIASAVADIVSSRLLRREDVARMVTGGSMGEALEQTINEEIEIFTEQLMFSLPMAVRSFLPEAIVVALRVKIEQKIHSKLPEIAGRAAELLDGTDIRDIVKNRIDQLEQIEMERIVLKIARRELRTIEVLGGLLGLLIGFVQLGIFLLVK